MEQLEFSSKKNYLCGGFRKSKQIFYFHLKGCLNIRAEIIPIEPEPGNAGVGMQ